MTLTLRSLCSSIRLFAQPRPRSPPALPLPPPPILPPSNVNFRLVNPAPLTLLADPPCHGMRASRLHQGLHFLPIRCGFFCVELLFASAPRSPENKAHMRQEVVVRLTPTTHE